LELCTSTGRKSSSFGSSGIGQNGLKPCLEATKKRLHHNVLAIALANERARIVCSIRWNGCRKFCFDLIVATATASSLPAGRAGSGEIPIPQEYNTGRIRMMSHDLESVALTLVAEGKGILAADETVPTLTRRFDTLGIQSTEQSRRTYREMLFTSPGAGDWRDD